MLSLTSAWFDFAGVSSVQSLSSLAQNSSSGRKPKYLKGVAYIYIYVYLFIYL